MKLKRIKCFLTGGHRYSDSNLQVIHDTTGYHCVKCGKVYAAVCGYSEVGRVVDKLVREKMISLHDYGKGVQV